MSDVSSTDDVVVHEEDVSGLSPGNQHKQLIETTQRETVSTSTGPISVAGDWDGTTIRTSDAILSPEIPGTFTHSYAHLMSLS